MCDSYVRQFEYASEGDPDSTSALTDASANEGWQAHVQGENGWSTARVRDLVATAVAEGAEGIVIVAGVNDMAWAVLA